MSRVSCIFVGVDMDSVVLTGEDFHDKFDPDDYMQMYRNGFSQFCSGGLPEFYLSHIHGAFLELPSSGLSVLDFGSGPSVLGAISAAPRSSEIVLSDYTEKNIKAAEKWLENDPSAYDWSSYFKYIIQDLEGLGAEAVKEREGMIRKVVKAVVECDINRDPPIKGEYNKEYDVVICSFVLEGATQSKDEYQAGMKRLAGLVKPGGLLLFAGVERSADVGFYMVGENKFQSLGVPSEFAVKSMEKAGLSDIKLETIPAKNKDETVVGYIFLRGKKI